MHSITLKINPHPHTPLPNLNLNEPIQQPRDIYPDTKTPKRPPINQLISQPNNLSINQPTNTSPNQPVHQLIPTTSTPPKNGKHNPTPSLLEHQHPIPPPPTPLPALPTKPLPKGLINNQHPRLTIHSSHLALRPKHRKGEPTR